MCGARVEGGWPRWAPLLLLASCSAAAAPSARDVADANDTGGKLNASSDSDRALLKELAALPNDTPRRVGGVSVLAEPRYAAASGRSCRALHVTPIGGQQPIHRLACSDGKTWFFVPDVFGGDGSAE